MTLLSSNLKNSNRHSSFLKKKSNKNFVKFETKLNENLINFVFNIDFVVMTNLVMTINVRRFQLTFVVK